MRIYECLRSEDRKFIKVFLQQKSTPVSQVDLVNSITNTIGRQTTVLNVVLLPIASWRPRGQGLCKKMDIPSYFVRRRIIEGKMVKVFDRSDVVKKNQHIMMSHCLWIHMSGSRQKICTKATHHDATYVQ